MEDTPKEEDPEESIPTMDDLQDLLKQERNKSLLHLAELENSRKRMQREKHGSTRFAVENVLLEILTPLDNFENALSFAHQTSEETQNWAKGFEMILSQFREILTSHKIAPFTSEGHPFDPHMHEVLEMEETELHEEGTVVQEFMKGYKCGDRVIRPARVKVAKKPLKEEETVNQEENIEGEQENEQ